MLINMLRERPGLRPAVVPKYATRRWRGLEDDTQFEREISDSTFDFVYPYHLNRYGIKASDISEILSTGRNAFVVVSPPRVVRSIKRYFGPLAVSIYLHSNRAEVQLEEIVARRHAAIGGGSQETKLEEEVKKRTINLRVMRRQYVDNIDLYDHVLLNTASPADLLSQLSGVVYFYSKNPTLTRRRVNGEVAIFLLCAPPSSGKGTLSEALRLMGTSYISNVTKVTDRAPRDNDGSEIHALGSWCGPDKRSERRGIIHEKQYDITYLFNDTRYGLNTEDIWTGISRGRAQLVITNMQVIPRLRRVFGSLIVPVYLYSTRTPREIRNYLIETKRLTGVQADRRLKKANLVFRDYIQHIDWFHHVLLNTGDVDDLIDQMFNLLSRYHSSL
jgi:guanylate kinase